MTKPRTKTFEELTAEIEDGKKKIRQFENREKMLRQKLSKEERRTRSHRLIVRGAVFESIGIWWPLWQRYLTASESRPTRLSNRLINKLRQIV